MVQSERRENIYFGHSKVMVDVLVFVVDNDFWASNGIFTALVELRVQGGHVDAVDFLSYCLGQRCCAVLLHWFYLRRNCL